MLLRLRHDDWNRGAIVQGGTPCASTTHPRGSPAPSVRWLTCRRSIGVARCGLVRGDRIDPDARERRERIAERP
jgi:hypothetical protein